MIRLPPRSTRTDTLCPYTTVFRSAYQIGGQFLFDQLSTVGPEGYEPTLEAIAEQAVVDDEAAIVRGLSIRGTLEPSRCDNFIAVKQGPGTMAFVAVSTYRTFRISVRPNRSEEHTSELQSLMRISYAVLCLTKKKKA